MSPATGRRYQLTMICEVWSIARSTVYQAEERGNDESREPKKRGPKTELSDEALVEEIRQVLEESDCSSEWLQRSRSGQRASTSPVGLCSSPPLLLSGSSRDCPAGGKGCSCERTDSWRRCVREGIPGATAATAAESRRTQRAVGHGCDQILYEGRRLVLVLRGRRPLRERCRRHVAKKGDRWAALEPIEGVRTYMDGYAPKIALGLGLRHDWGPQYTAHQFQGELAWLGIRSTASYVGEPECNGLIERFILQHDFESLEEARTVIASSVTTAVGSSSGTATRPRPRSAAHPHGGLITPPTCPGNRDRFKVSRCFEIAAYNLSTGLFLVYELPALPGCD